MLWTCLDPISKSMHVSLQKSYTQKLGWSIIMCSGSKCFKPYNVTRFSPPWTRYVWGYLIILFKISGCNIVYLMLLSVPVCISLFPKLTEFQTSKCTLRHYKSWVFDYTNINPIFKCWVNLQKKVQYILTPSLSLVLILAPSSTRCSTILKRALFAATCKGVIWWRERNHKHNPLPRRIKVQSNSTRYNYPTFLIGD